MVLGVTDAPSLLNRCSSWGLRSVCLRLGTGLDVTTPRPEVASLPDQRRNAMCFVPAPRSTGITPGTTQASTSTIRTNKPSRVSEYLIVLRKISVSLQNRSVAAQAIAIDCGEISLPATPPKMLAEVVSTGFIPVWVAVTCCSLPNKAADDVTEPVRNTPNHPIAGEKTGNNLPA